MKDIFRHNYSVTTSGESHGEAIGCVVSGLASGVKLDMDFIVSVMEKQRAKGRISTQRRETDELHIVSGYFSGHTTGTSLTILIENINAKSHDYKKVKYRLRPSHANHTADEKYMDWQDYHGGGHFSGRITAPLVAVSAITMQVLKEEGALVGSHIQKNRTIKDIPFPENTEGLQEQMERVNTMDFAVLNDTVAAGMKAMVGEVINEGGSVGGILESCILNVLVDLREPFFGSLENTLSCLLFSVPVVKGIELGLDFGFSDVYGSGANDPVTYDKGLRTATDNNGGINGGISSGMPIRIHTVIKPAASVYKGQNTVDLKTHEVVKLQIQERHDSVTIHRARAAVDSVLTVDILDQPVERSATMTMK